MGFYTKIMNISRIDLWWPYEDRLSLASEKPEINPLAEKTGLPRFYYDMEGKDEYEGKYPAPTFEEIINLIPEEKRILIGL